MKRYLILVALAVVVFAIEGEAQMVTGNLEGRAVTAEGQPIPGAEVAIEGFALQGIRAGATDKDGRFRLAELPVGLYTLRIRHVAHQPAAYGDIRISLGKTTTLGALSLQSRVVALPEVVVSAVTPLIDPTTAARGVNLPESTFVQLPTDRNFRSLVMLAPEVTTTFFEDDDVNIAGGSGLETVYYVDGIHMTDPFKGGFGSELPYNFVKEVELKTGGYEAEYGRALGGIVNVVTQSGSNQPHGQLFGFFTSDGLAGDSRYGLAASQMTSFENYDVGFSLGGPLVRDRLWGFAAYNPSFDNREIVLPGAGTARDEKKTHLFAGKLSWQAGERSSLAFTILGDPSRRHAVGPSDPARGNPAAVANPEVLLGLRKRGSVSAMASAKTILGSRWILDGILYHHRRIDENRPDPDRGLYAPVRIDEPTGTWSGGYGAVFVDQSRRTGISVSATAVLGDHAVKAGVAFENNALDREFDWQPPALGFLHRLDDTTYVWESLYWKGKLTMRVPSAYVQDSWRLGGRLRVNAGLRWDGIYFADVDGHEIPSITDQFQPRVGLVYALGEGNRQKLFGSFGRFYEQFLGNGPGMGYCKGLWEQVGYDHDPVADPGGGRVLLSVPMGSLENLERLEGQHYDEFALGYERQLGGMVKVGLRGVYRTLRQGIEDSVDPATGSGVMGNPGKGRLAHLPEMTHDYKALELTLDGSAGARANWLVAYVLSRTSGNYTGLYGYELSGAYPNGTTQFDALEQIPNSDGLLANDRTHVFKAHGSYEFPIGLDAGTTFLWASGTPVDEFGGTTWGSPYFAFLRPRGSAGRTPAIYDWNLRFTYAMPFRRPGAFKTKLLLDVFHIGNPRKPVMLDEVHYYGLDESGNQTLENPNYLQPTRYQPPTSMRLGVLMEF